MEAMVLEGVILIVFANFIADVVQYRLDPRVGTATRLTYSAPPRSAAARSGSQRKPYWRRMPAGSSPTVIWFTNSTSGRRCSGTGGRRTMSTASSRAAGVTYRSPLAYMSAM